jgi:hypothetical protein
MTDHLESKNLVPFSKRHNGFQLPGVGKDRDEELLEAIDPEMTAEDEGVIRRYLHYADTLLGEPEQGNLTLVQGGGPAKRLVGNPETQRQPTLEQESLGDNTDSSDRQKRSDQAA